MKEKLTIGFAGLSHLGLVSGIAVASKGFKVVGFDASRELVEQLNGRRLPVHEPQLDDLLAKSSTDISFTSSAGDLSSCDVVYISCDIKTREDNTSDLAGIHELIDTVAPNLKKGSTLVVLSQVPPGFTRKLAIPGVNIIYQVETLIFGRAVERALYPERYIIGCGDPNTPLPAALHSLLSAFNCPILPMKYESAELAKISINFFLVASVSTTNTLAEVCENIGADWNEIAPALRLDKRIGQYAYLSPGLGIAGGNLERDLMTVTQISCDKGTDNGVIASWLKNSRYRKDWATRALNKELYSKGASKNAVIAMWGIAYKQDTKSTKNSPALHFAEGMKQVPVRAYDPQVELGASQRESLGSQFRQVSSALEACAGADALVILTPWKEFSEIAPAEIAAKLKGRLVIDPLAVLDVVACRKAGLKQIRMGVGEK